MSEFDLNKEINEYPVANMFKAGFKYYIKSRGLKISSKKDFDKALKDFEKLNIGA